MQWAWDNGVGPGGLGGRPRSQRRRSLARRMGCGLGQQLFTDVPRNLWGIYFQCSHLGPVLETLV